MALPKSTLDVQASDGLNQKIDVRRLPLGKSAKALNLVKNKQGRLEKRLGFALLSNSDPLSVTSGFAPFTANQGIALGTWNNNLTVISRGTWTSTGASVTALSTFSPDLNGMVHRGQMPDVKIAADQILTNTPTLASSPTVCLSGNYAVMVWGDGPAPTTDSIQQSTSLYWAAWETDTGNIVQPATPLLMSTQVVYFRLAIVGTTFVLCLNTLTATSNIYCYTLPVANLTDGAGWVNNGPIITDQCGQTPSTYPFDMRSVSGDTTAFVLAYEKGVGGSLTTPLSIVCQRWTISPVVALNATFTVQGTPSATISPTALAIRADAGTGRVAVAYAQPRSLAFPTAASAWQLHAAVGTYPAMGFENGSSTNDTVLYTGIDGDEPWPIWMDIIQCGSGGQLTGLSWTVIHSPEGAVWNNVKQRQGVFQTAQNRIGNSTHTGSFNPIKSRCARIITNQFQDGTNALATYADTSGANAGITPGLILASRGIEANGLAYFLGWVPSQTQGSFVVLAYDQMANPFQPSTSFPMRPVGNLQVRMALSDPGAGSVIGDAGFASYAYDSVAPSVWTGASEWQLLGSDIFSTSYVGYVSGTQGQRTQPAYGAIQLAPLTGYASAQWGSLTGFGGGLPVCFDGQSVFEQGFLYAPESIIVDPGAATAVGALVTLAGPYWASASDSYSWIFTWEQFDAQGNYHLSARSTPVTVTGANLAGFDGGSLSSGFRRPTFYIPTLGATCRAPFGSTPSVRTFNNRMSTPNYPVTLGVYRTTMNGQVYYRVADRFYNGSDPLGGLPTNKTDNSGFITFQDKYADSIGNTAWTGGGGTGAGNVIDDGTHPFLYGDGTNGSPGSLDNFCPPSSAITVRHKERLFVARNNQVLFTKARGELAGPGYNEQVNVFNVGDNTPIVQMESMDDNLVIFKPNQLYYVSGDGPADDGSGNSFSNPQPIPTDAGCSDPGSIRSTPEGVYFMSAAGLRRLSRNLSVEYVGGPVEDELAIYPDVRSVVLYPGQNRVVFAVTNNDSANTGGEMIWRDYVLDAWTTAQIDDAGTLRTPVALAVANAPRASVPPNTPAPVLHFLSSNGRLWREKDPDGLDGDTIYYDNNTYVSSTWATAPIKQQDGQRFRLWDVVTFGQSADPHGLIVTTTVDDGTNPEVFTWVWNSNTGAPSIQPGGVAQTGLTRMRAYDGRLGASFQVTIQDVSDTSSVSGQGLQLLGLSLTIGVAPGPYKLAPGSTQ